MRTISKPRGLPAAPSCPHCHGRASKRVRAFPITVSCDRGHIWHTCQIHRSTVLGRPSQDSGCTCHSSGAFGRPIIGQE